MARPLRIEYEGAFYHVTARGNERKEIYSSDKDRKQFLGYIESANQRFGIKIHAYCLMSNHYHLLIETPRAQLSRSLQYINSSYTTYYNHKQKRNGHLFQGRYKAILIETDVYLQALSRYIHLNPVRAKIVDAPELYQWSSYKYYAGVKKDIPEYLDIRTTFGYFSSKSEYLNFVVEGIGQQINNPDEMAKGGCILGQEEFIKEIKEKYLDEDKQIDDLPGLKELNRLYIDSANIKKIIEEAKDIVEKEKRKLIIYFIRKYTDITLKSIVDMCSDKQSISSISKIVKRLDARRRVEKELDEIMKNLDCEMSKVKV